MNCTVSSPKFLRVLWSLKLLYYRENFPEFQVRVKIDVIFTECTYLGLTLQICIRQVLGSYLGQDIEYPDRFLDVFLSSSKKMLGQYLEQFTTASCKHLSIRHQITLRHMRRKMSKIIYKNQFHQLQSLLGTSATFFFFWKRVTTRKLMLAAGKTAAIKTNFICCF